MKILDRYIIKSFLGTFLFALVFLVSIAVVLDFSQRMQRLEAHQGSIREALLEYYPLWALWLGSTFMPIGVFISVIFFTSRLSENTEIVAISSSAIRTSRLIVPYLFSALSIALVSLALNHYVLPITNKKKNSFHYKYLLSPLSKRAYDEDKKVSLQISNDQYLFINKFSKKQATGQGIVYQKYKGRERLSLITADTIKWDPSTKEYIFYNYNQRYLEGKEEAYRGGYELRKDLGISPQELTPEEYLAETMNTFQLKEFIEIERKKGGKQLNNFLNEYYQRTSLPFSTIILTFLAFSISSQKRRGGIGFKLALGLTLAFLYLFSMEFSKSLSTKQHFSSFWAVWLPNIFFGGVAGFFYWKRANK